MTSFVKIITSLITLLAQTPGREKVTIILSSWADYYNISQSIWDPDINRFLMLNLIFVMNSCQKLKNQTLFGPVWVYVVKCYVLDLPSPHQKHSYSTQYNFSKVVSKKKMRIQPLSSF